LSAAATGASADGQYFSGREQYGLDRWQARAAYHGHVFVRGDGGSWYADRQYWIIWGNDMPAGANSVQFESFLGRGWTFPPSFKNGEAVMVEDEADIQQSLQILFQTIPGERFLEPKFGLDMQALMFEPLSTTLRTLVTDQITTAILIYEPRIKVLNLSIDTPDPNQGSLRVLLEYQTRATNSRFNLVFPFYDRDSNEVRAALGNSRG
jgi:phage baseplate assembly protein W